MLGLDPCIDQRPPQLPVGERQRVVIGRAMVREPEVFLFDEPPRNLDAQLRNQTRIEIKRLQDDRKFFVDGTAAMYLIGDWHSGSFAAADMELGVDFGTFLMPAPHLTSRR